MATSAKYPISNGGLGSPSVPLPPARGLRRRCHYIATLSPAAEGADSGQCQNTGGATRVLGGYLAEGNGPKFKAQGTRC
jgi:hypothetical protein